jgi:CheY-like chemotaxis protein
VERTFRHVAETKNVDFEIAVDPDLCPSIKTDSKRLQQIIKNLLSNAFKFTRRGRVSLNIGFKSAGWSADNDNLNRAASVLAIEVEDTGIGISSAKQQIIFEAFQQADGSTSRKFGGTGLGLAISRELARLLGGEIGLRSTPGIGSTFTLYMPLAQPMPSSSILEPLLEARREYVVPAVVESATYSDSIPDEVGDDRELISHGDRVLLVVDNDLAFAKVLMEAGREVGFKVIVTSLGASALALAKEHLPSAITLDLSLPDLGGWRVLDRLQNDPAVRHIPVYIISTADDVERGLQLGAVGVLAKPLQTRDEIVHVLTKLRELVDRSVKSLVFVGRSADKEHSLRERFANANVEIISVPTCAEAASLTAERKVDCVVADVASLEEPIETLARAIGKADSDTTLVFWSEDELSQPVEALRNVDGCVAPKHAQSMPRLLDQVIKSLHLPIDSVSREVRHMLDELYSSDAVLRDKRVLIVDDDIRNIFALASVLESHHMQIFSAETGHDAIRLLKETPDIDIVLMDIMMPEMDGIATMYELRKLPELKNLPIIAVTAKAMKGDREKCIEAGAWDYLSKPVDTDQLLSVMRSWLYR